jgi:hypothetical protein
MVGTNSNQKKPFNLLRSLRAFAGFRKANESLAVTRIARFAEAAVKNVSAREEEATQSHQD